MAEKVRFQMVCGKCRRANTIEENVFGVCVNCGLELPSVSPSPDFKTDERLALEGIIEAVYEGKTVTIEPDFEIPYTLIIGDSHTHCSYALDGMTDRAHAINLAVDSLIRHLARKGGMSFNIDLKEEKR